MTTEESSRNSVPSLSTPEPTTQFLSEVRQGSEFASGFPMAIVVEMFGELS